MYTLSTCLFIHWTDDLLSCSPSHRSLARYRPLLQLRNLSLPVQREAVEVKLMLCDLMVDMFVQFSEEERAKRQTEARRGSIQKVQIPEGPFLCTLPPLPPPPPLPPLFPSLRPSSPSLLPTSPHPLPLSSLPFLPRPSTPAPPTSHIEARGIQRNPLQVFPFKLWDLASCRLIRPWLFGRESMLKNRLLQVNLLCTGVFRLGWMCVLSLSFLEKHSDYSESLWIEISVVRSTDLVCGNY